MVEEIKEEKEQEVPVEREEPVKEIREEEEVVRESASLGNSSNSRVPVKLPFQHVRVSFPRAKEGPLSNYMVYKLHYTLNDKELEVSRRFSDFSILRDALRRELPCHFIFPAHKKKTVGSKKTEFIIDRLEELNSFIEYIMSKPELFNLPCIFKFFDTSISDTKIGEILEKSSPRDFRVILERMEQAYPEFASVG